MRPDQQDANNNDELNKFNTTKEKTICLNPELSKVGIVPTTIYKSLSDNSQRGF